jgi:ElaB/YqjD/DUF883 family membrane-anchored ribosome-binding protein
MSDEFTAATRGQAGQTVDDLKALLREAETALANVGDKAGDELDNLRERVRRAVADGKNAFAEATALARKQAARADALVRANPYASIGIATGTGLLVGYLLARSFCRD